MREALGVVAGTLILVPLLGRVAAAQSSPDYARNSIYLSFAGLYAFEDFSRHIHPDLAAPVSAEDSLGFTGRLGWRFTRWTAVEISGEYIPFAAKTPSFPQDFTAIAGMTQFKGILPLGRVEPYALVGVGALVIVDADVADSSGFAWRAGLGVQFHVFNHLAAFLEGSYLGPTGDLSEIPYGSFVWGLQGASERLELAEGGRDFGRLGSA